MADLYPGIPIAGGLIIGGGIDPSYGIAAPIGWTIPGIPIGGGIPLGAPKAPQRAGLIGGAGLQPGGMGMPGLLIPLKLLRRARKGLLCCSSYSLAFISVSFLDLSSFGSK